MMQIYCFKVCTENVAPPTNEGNRKEARMMMRTFDLASSLELRSGALDLGQREGRNKVSLLVVAPARHGALASPNKVLSEQDVGRKRQKSTGS